MSFLVRNRTLHCLAIAMVVINGCSRVKKFSFPSSWENAPSYHDPVQTRIEYPGVNSCLEPEVTNVQAPLTVENPADLITRDIELNEVIRLGLTSGDILRTLGGSVVANPFGTQTQYDPAVTESNPLGGVEAALSAFDAQVAGQLFWQKNNIPNNTTFLIFQPSALQQTGATFNYEIAKRTATGARFAARHVMQYNRNNSPVRFFPSDYVGWFEAEYRQPLLRGAGLDFNRIAGPNSQVGQYNGVLIARINTDISLADFEQGIITYINDIETAYWELFFAYHSLQTLVDGRNTALIEWQRTKQLAEFGARGGDAGAVAQAQSQYYLFEVNAKEALSGPNGLYAAEQRLRYLLGLPPTDGSLLKPITQPMEGEVIVDWYASLNDALLRRVEIRRQKWNIKRRELEMIAARLNRKPTLDFLGQYRYRGLGDDLFGSRDPANSFDNVYQNIFEGDYQEWQAGVELGYPVGFRQAGAAVANARLNLARDRALLKEQELKISHDLSNASRQISRSFELLKSNFNRQNADRNQVEALRIRVREGADNINFLLQAQQRLAQSTNAYFRSLTDYQLALRDFHREKGSLLNYNQVGLSEGAWPGAAYQDAEERGRFLTPRTSPENVSGRWAISGGAFNPTNVGAGTGSVGPVSPPVPATMPAAPTEVVPEPDDSEPTPSAG